VNDAGQKVLYAIACGAPPARDIGKLVDLAQAAGWDVCVITSPDGRRFVDVEALTAKTGHTVRSEYKQPDATDELPPADAMIVAPATCNTVAKWAAGISDALPLGLVVEAVGKGLPVVAMPFSNRAQLSFPAVDEALHKLASWGVKVLAGDGTYRPHEPGTGGDYIHLFPWHLALESAESELSKHSAQTRE
jgi:phosphopantothenoylcysteine synthetase/decarboxylase